MNIALYARVSTRDKGQDHENQLSQMLAWADANGHKIAMVYVDQVSGSGKKHRSEFTRMLSEAGTNWQMLVFWSLDRFGREGVFETLRCLKHLDDKGVCWRSHTEAYLDSCGIFKDAVTAILAAIAKQERVRISERVIAGLDYARVKGARGELSQSGKRLAGSSGRGEAEYPVGLVREIARCKAAGKTYDEIAAELSAGGVGRYSRASVHRMHRRMG